MFEQDRFIVRLQQRVMREAGLEVCFLTGSYGRRTEDAYSDLDVILVFGDEAMRDSAWSNRRNWVQSVLPYVPAKSFDGSGSYEHCALYSNGAKVDYWFYAQNSLEPQPHWREIRILKDSDRWAEQLQQASARILPTRQRVEANQMERIDNRFWVTFWDIYRRLLRGDVEGPFTVYLELLYATLPPLLGTLPPEDPAYQQLIGARYTRDAEETLDHLRRLLDAYLAARAAVIRRHNVGFIPDTGFERGLRQTMERRGR